MAWQGREPGRSLEFLKKVRRNVPIVLHGVSLNIGSVDPLDKNYLQRLKQLIDVIEPEWVSDHLCWTGVNGENLHDLLPVPYTEESLRLIAEKLDEVQNYLGRRILIENPSSYLEFKQSTISEWDFIGELVARADAGLLLDVNNVYVSSVNHGFDPRVYLKAIPWNRVGQIHLAGHSDMGGYLIDTHDAPVCNEVWSLYRQLMAEKGAVSTMIERDANIPEWSILETELLQIQRIQNGEKHQCASVTL